MTTDTVGGVWTFTQELSLGLLERGTRVYLVSLGRVPSPSQQNWLDDVRKEWGMHFSCEACDVPLEWMEENARAYDAAPRLRQIACEWGADIVHSNQFCFGALPLEIPKLITAHSDVFSWAECCRGGFLEDSAWLRRYRALVTAGLIGTESIVCPTAWLAERLARNFSIAGEQSVIPNGRSIIPEKQESRLQAVTAGRVWDEAKNVGILCDVRSPIPILVAGEKEWGSTTPAPLPEEMLLGPLSEPDLLRLFGQSQIYICTSRYEPFGLAPLEAALCGCAVIASDIASLREVWEDGALYFNGVETLSALLCWLHDNPQELRAAQRRSLSRARQFSGQRMTHSYLELYRMVLAKAESTTYAA